MPAVIRHWGFKRPFQAPTASQSSIIAPAVITTRIGIAARLRSFYQIGYKSKTSSPYKLALMSSEDDESHSTGFDGSLSIISVCLRPTPVFFRIAYHTIIARFDG